MRKFLYALLSFLPLITLSETNEYRLLLYGGIGKPTFETSTLRGNVSTSMLPLFAGGLQYYVNERLEVSASIVQSFQQAEFSTINDVTSFSRDILQLYLQADINAREMGLTKLTYKFSPYIAYAVGISFVDQINLATQKISEATLVWNLSVALGAKQIISPLFTVFSALRIERSLIATPLGSESPESFDSSSPTLFNDANWYLSVEFGVSFALFRKEICNCL